VLPICILLKMSGTSTSAYFDAAKNYNLAEPFSDTSRRYPDRIALCVDGRKLTYAETLKEVVRIVHWMRACGTPPKRVGILAARGLEAYVGILASAWVGAAYVPIDIALPKLALIALLNRSGLDVLITDPAGSAKISENVLAACPPRVLVSRRDLPIPANRPVTDFDELLPVVDPGEPALMAASEPGYMMYTSGSTGVPKAVIVTVGGVDHLLWTLSHDYPVRKEDRVAGTSPISFDASVYDMFSAWQVGAALYIIPVNVSLAPAKFLQENEITIWFSAPSIAAQMARMGLLKPDAFPSLHRSLFSGEALPRVVAEAWQAAAPNSKVINLWGATEISVMGIGQDYSPDCYLTGDFIAIGRPYRGVKTAIADDNLKLIGNEAKGELLLGGPQLALGYLDDEERTRRAFVEIEGEKWYRTGDLARRDANGVLHYLGRIDHQVKVLGGARVELGEIESHLRAVTDCESVAAVAWPMQDGVALGIVGFIGGFNGKATEVRNALKERLPSNMVPSRIQIMSEIPLNSNGKVDRKQLIATLTEQSKASAS
jgi:D-alanine--poly(phosphoribitol) ligase subunit 1